MSITEQGAPARPSRDGAGGAQETLKAAKTPVGPGAITFVGAVLSLLVIAIGTVGLQTAASAVAITNSQPWLTRAIKGTNGLRPLWWMLILGIVLVLAGLWLLVTALRPRPKTAVALNAQTGVFLRPRDLARLAEHAADDVDGVAAIHARATRGKVTLRVESTGGPGVAEAVKAAVAERFAAVRRAPRVSVKTREVTP